MRARWIIPWGLAIVAAPVIARAQATPAPANAPVLPPPGGQPVVGAQLGDFGTVRPPVAPHASRPAAPNAPAPFERIQTESQDAPTPADPPLTRENSDVAFWGGFTAKEIRWKIVPNVKVRTYGSQGVASQWTGERVNLPKPVKREETYRNAGGNFEILTRLPDEKSVTYSTTYEPVPPAGVTPARKAEKLNLRVDRPESNASPEPLDGRIPPPRPPKKAGAK